MKLCIGLFGTCAGSKWREPFKEKYLKEGIEFFDPQKPDWKPEDAEIEAEHLAEDTIILFPVTSESYGTGSLAEIGFCVFEASLDRHRNFVILIDKNLDKKLLENQVAAKESTRSRILVREHLKRKNLPNLHIVETLEEMFEVSLKLYESTKDSFLRDLLDKHYSHNE